MQKWYVYILECADTSLYTGITTDIERRLHEHNFTKKGAKYTANRRPVSLSYSERHDDRSSASKRESQIKTLTRKQKLDLVNPDPT